MRKTLKFTLVLYIGLDCRFPVYGLDSVNGVHSNKGAKIQISTLTMSIKLNIPDRHRPFDNLLFLVTFIMSLRTVLGNVPGKSCFVSLKFYFERTAILYTIGIEHNN